MQLVQGIHIDRRLVQLRECPPDLRPEIRSALYTNADCSFRHTESPIGSVGYERTGRLPRRGRSERDDE